MRRSFILYMVGLLFAASAAQATGPIEGPREGFLTEQDIEWARIEAANRSPQAPGWEHPEPFEAEAGEQGHSLRLASDDDDTAHYCRGSTLILHVFIDHLGGTWEGSEMAAAGAKAEVAKSYFRTNSPALANVTFDHEGITGYNYYNPYLAVNIPDDTTGPYIYDAIQACGFTDTDGDGFYTDDFTLWHQNWNGGWDNVIAIYQAADNTGRAFASYGTASVVCYTNSDGVTWAHEFGHSYGACDEYVEGGQCNGGIDCGPCQSTYLTSVISNGNCHLPACPLHDDCMMKNESTTNICPYTLEHWGWVDDDSNNLLDDVKRRVSGTSFAMIWELYPAGWFSWNYTGDGMAYSQSSQVWAVSGVRPRTTADFDIYLYGDNSHNYPLASSTYGGTYVDFVVSDYNHTRTGNEHLEVRHYTGPADTYDLQWEGGPQMLFADGAVRAGSWSDGDVVQIWDVPLFAGESVAFDLDVTGGSLDLGMALFKSSGDSYWAGRGAALWQADAFGAGSDESGYYTVPEDDVYGLVVWSNTRTSGSFSIQLGPSPVALAEETPFTSDASLRLHHYDPNAGYWSFVGNRPLPGTNTTVKLFADPQYQELLGTSSSGDVDFITVDNNHEPMIRGHVRVIREGAGSLHTTEWEHDADILPAAMPMETWDAGHVGKIWDVFLPPHESYFFRQYHWAGAFDTGLYLFSSADGDYYKPPIEAAAVSDSRPASEGGEWFHISVPSYDWCGVTQIVHDETSADYAIWYGPDVGMEDDIAVTREEQLLWGHGLAETNYWHVFAARPTPGDIANVWLYGDDAYTISNLLADDQGAGPGEIACVVADYNHINTGPVYPRFLREGWAGPLDAEYEGQAENIIHLPGSVARYDDYWPAHDVAEAYDLWISQGSNVHVRVEDLSGNLDLIVALFRSQSANWYGTVADAQVVVNGEGVGGAEEFDYYAPANDWYGLIVANANDADGAFRIHVGDASAVAVVPAKAPPQFEFTAYPNPFRGSAALRFSLPRAADVDVAVYDVSGRLVRRLLDEPRSMGRHTLAWDARDDAGRNVAAGIYLARIRAPGFDEYRKLVRLP